MEGQSRHELYTTFIELVRVDLQLERNQMRRRMFSVFLWCFLLPAVMVAGTLLLAGLGILPRTARGYVDWMVLIPPIFYSLYILGSEVVSEVPSTFRRGGMAATLGQSIREGLWRDRVCGLMEKALPHASTEDWRWIVASFRVDLDNLQYRTRYLTALAGAVFFLIMQGIDSITDTEEGKVTWVRNSVLGWIETNSSDLSQFVGLALFLVLLYLSGSQTYHALNRYLNCAELLLKGALSSRKPQERRSP